MILNTEKVQVIKARTGITSKELAKRYGCTVARINMAMRQRNARTETINKLASALGVDVTDIIIHEEV